MPSALISVSLPKWRFCNLVFGPDAQPFDLPCKRLTGSSLHA